MNIKRKFHPLANSSYSGSAAPCWPAEATYTHARARPTIVRVATAATVGREGKEGKAACPPLKNVKPPPSLSLGRSGRHNQLRLGRETERERQPSSLRFWCKSSSSSLLKEESERYYVHSKEANNCMQRRSACAAVRSFSFHPLTDSTNPADPSKHGSAAASISGLSEVQSKRVTDLERLR